VNLPAASINGISPTSIAISLFGSAATRFVNLELSALEADQRGKVVSSPRVLTGDKTKAVIEQGTELPYQTQAGGLSAPVIQFRKAVLKLEVTPQITPEGTVIMKVAVNRDAVGQLTPAGGTARGGNEASGHLATVQLTPTGSRGFNPAFDVTPARLVTALITERGVAPASEEGLQALYSAAVAPS
jgi:Flp pilus assembly secretin CpaC